MSVDLDRLAPEVESRLLARPGAKKRGTEIVYRCLLPERHHNGDAHPSASYSTDKRAHCCNGCGISGGLVSGAYPLARLLEIDPNPYRRFDADARSTGQPDRTWEIRDREGAVVALHHRRNGPNGKRLWWTSPDGRSGLDGQKAADLPLYATEKIGVREPGEDAPIVVCEGEPATDALLALGLQAVGTVTGANGVPNVEPLEILRGRDVVLFPDADEPGRAHMQQLAARLEGIAASVRIFAPEELGEGGDAVDWTRARQATPNLGTVLLGEIEEKSRGVAPKAAAADPTGETFTPPADPWPSPLGEGAYHGLVGEIVRFLEPHTEADPAALLVQTLALAGAFIGAGPYFPVEADRHPARLFAVVVGETAKGRKGTGFGCARRVFELAERMPPRASGLSSGEGLIWGVRDAIYKQTDEGESCTDKGVTDKRLLVVETEFGGTLRMIGREGNTLSAVLRDSWDHGNLRTLTKNSPACATGAHVAVLGHITAEELLHDLTATDAASGFANRFLWVCSRRSKLLPEGGSLPDQHLDLAATELRRALDLAQQPHRWERDPEAGELWRSVYPVLSTGKAGMLGALTSRAEAQTMRLALVYALLDAHRGASQIQRQHLEAALEVWRYCADSARAIFGDRMGGKADDAMALLRAAGSAGMSRSAIGEVVFGKHVTAAKLDAALAPLLRYGRARTGTGPVAGGRPPEWWWAL